MYTPKPFNEGFLSEEDGHKIYYAEYGNPDGEVIVNLHGGPGSRSKPKHASRLNHEVNRIILFDQRGCGKSTPRGSLKENTTEKLISDMEHLREQLGVEKWFVAGSSWGSTLALAYAEAYKDRVKGLLLSAIFLADQVGLGWFGREPIGAALTFKDIWEKRQEDLAELGITGSDCAGAMYKMIAEGNLDQQKAITAVFANWESNLLSAFREVSFIRPEEVEEDDINDARLFLHYEANNFFLVSEHIMQNISKIKDIPTIIVHGRHDMICPFEQAWKLHKAMTNSKLVTVPQSNHAFTLDGEVARSQAFEAFLKDF